ncbi:MAG TPA: hypothetical protein VHP33_28700 [Polyangiaceae bacterium]|nr:hypothetical protein [Polyangiaceae bacterium]
MRTRGSVRFVLATLLGLSSAGSARAQLLVVDTPGEPPAIEHAELSYASGAGTPVTWLSLRVQRGPVAVVAALPEGANADVGLDAWLSALEVTASPNVLLPSSRTNCGQTGSFAHVAWPRSGGVSATELLLPTAEDVQGALEGEGLTLDRELPFAKRYVVWSWPAADKAQTTRTLRVAGGPEPLSLLPGSAFPLHVSSITRGAVALPQESLNDELSVTFVAAERPSSDYRERLQDWLDSRSEPLLEARARGPLFDWTIYSDAVSLASLVGSYAQRAGKELPELDAAACGDQLRALRDPGAPSAAACGDASDAALALAAAGSEQPTLQRFVVSGLNGFVPTGAAPGGEANPPVLRARLLDDSGCAVKDPPPTVVPPVDRGGGDVSGPRGTTTVVVEETVVVDESPRGDVYCGGSPQPEPRDEYYQSESSCSSDTSSTSDTDSDSSDCGGDSSSSSSSDSSGCSSDTSSSSDSEPETTDCASDSSGSSSDSSDSGCGSDSSSSSDSSDSGCSGGSDESSGYDGDTCTGAAAPGGERTQKASAGLSSRPHARRPQRLKTSLWSMAFVAVVLPIRRRKRGLSSRG